MKETAFVEVELQFSEKGFMQCGPSSSGYCNESH